MRALILLLVAALALPPSRAIRRSCAPFRAKNPCPATGKTSGACPGFVDHRIPLCAGGPDDVRNMAWQSVPDAKAKDGWERALCARLARCPVP